MEYKDVEKEFEIAIAEYGGLITKICYYFASDSEEFKDLRQEVFYISGKDWIDLEKILNYLPGYIE